MPGNRRAAHLVRPPPLPRGTYRPVDQGQDPKSAAGSWWHPSQKSACHDHQWAGLEQWFGGAGGRRPPPPRSNEAYRRSHLLSCLELFVERALFSDPTAGAIWTLTRSLTSTTPVSHQKLYRGAAWRAKAKLSRCPSIPLPDFGDNGTRRLFSSEMPPGVILSSRELQYTRIRTSLAGRRHMAIEC